MPRMSRYIYHLTVTTGHGYQSPSDEVSDAVTLEMSLWLDEIVNTGQQHPLLGDLGNNYAAQATAERGELMLTVYARQHDAAVSRHPLATLAVAPKSKHSARVWAIVTDGRLGPTAPNLREPRAPWCAVHLHPALLGHLDATQWLADFERCVAWAWVGA